MDLPVVIIDNGTGYTKMGLAGNQEPDYIIPTAIATHDTLGVSVSRMQCVDLDFFIGDQAYQHVQSHNLSNPIKEGTINNWDDMERFWQHSIYKMMNVEPEQHNILLTEPPLNPPENREQMAEIMFETFNVPGLYIGVQAVMALFGSTGYQETNELTGTIIDSGDGVTHIIPVAHGYVISSSIKDFPIAGRDITKFIMNKLKERGEPAPHEDLLDIARIVKEKFAYVSKNVDADIEKFNKENRWKTYEGIGRTSGRPVKVNVGTEKFLAPEVFFDPGRLTNDWDKPLDEILDQTIQTAPIDLRRALYSNITLSGGTTMFKGFNRKLQRAMQNRVDQRLQRYRQVSGADPKPIKVKIDAPGNQRFAVWYGASVFASQEAFKGVLHTREQYLEYGPSIARMNVVFGQ